jgi:alpha-N-arabinofuranosidase
MRKTLFVILLGIGCTNLSAAPAADSDPVFEWFEYAGTDSVYTSLKKTNDQYWNPILAGFYPDPSIARAGDDYYLVTSSFAYFPGVPIFRSKDLVNWTQIGHVLDRPSQLKLDSLGISRGIFAPAISYHAGTFYMITTVADAGGNFIVTATNPAGPWSEPMWLKTVDGIDPSLFFDDDGKIYIVNNGPPEEQPLYNGHRAIWIQQWDKASNTMVGPRKVIVNGGVDLSKKPIWIEAPHVFKRGGTYYLICAEGGTGDQHSEVVFRSSSVFGPFVPYDKNPILTQRHLNNTPRPFPISTTGHADFVRTPTDEWWAVFLGARPYRPDMYNTGRETFMLPVTWKNGWPVILEGPGTVPYAVRRPDLPRQPEAKPALSGNFVDRDEFDARDLRYQWIMIRTPRERWFDLASSPGSLTLRARPEKLGERGQPSFLGRRQQHISASASVAMRYAPDADGDKAGIVAFQNDDHFYFLGVGRDGGTSTIRLERAVAGGAPGAAEVVASAPFAQSGTGVIFLKITARGGQYDFSYGTRAGEWTTLAKDGDGTILSTKKAGGFVGSLFGLYAHSNARRSQSH